MFDAPTIGATVIGLMGIAWLSFDLFERSRKKPDLMNEAMTTTLREAVEKDDGQFALLACETVLKHLESNK